VSRPSSCSSWLGTSFDVPVLLLHGERDMHAVGHMAPFVRPDLIETELITRILPLATRACRA
jgi:hypothetical protein